MTITTVTDQPRIIQYSATASQTTFAYPFPIFVPQDLVVDVNGTIATYQSPSVDAGTYDVTGAGNNSGGNVVLKTASTLHDVVTIYSDLVIQRISQYSQNAKWSSDAANADLNRLTLMALEREDSIGRVLRVPDTEAAGIPALPSAASRANKILSFDAYGQPTFVTGVSGTLTETYGTFTASWVGFSSAPSNTTIFYRHIGSFVWLYGSESLGTSNVTNPSFTGLPQALWPVLTSVYTPVAIKNNSTKSMGVAYVNTSGSITLFKDGAFSNFSDAANTGLSVGWCIAYSTNG